MIGFKGETALEKVMRMPSLADFLHSVPHFRVLGAEEIKRIAEEAFERSFTKGEVLFLEVELCRGLYVGIRHNKRGPFSLDNNTGR